MAWREQDSDVSALDECVCTPPDDASAADNMAAFDRRPRDDDDDDDNGRASNYELGMQLCERVSITTDLITTA